MPETIRARTSGAARARQMHQILYQKAVFQGAFLGPSNKDGPPAPLYFPLLGSETLGSPKLQNLANRLCAVSIVLYSVRETCSTVRESLKRGGVVLKHFRRYGTVSLSQIFPELNILRDSPSLAVPSSNMLFVLL